MKRDTLIVLGLILAVAVIRLLPHPWNIAPIGALGLFAGAYLPYRVAWLFPLGALLVGDAATGFYNALIMLFVYAGFFASAFVGRAILFQGVTLQKLGIAIVSSAGAFFLLSNFGSWLAHYPQTLEGLVACYINAIPYFGRSLIGDTLYAALLFGSYEAAKLFTVRLRYDS